MKQLYFSVLLLIIATTTNAQVQFLLQNRTKGVGYTKVYYDINDAYTNAQTGDTIYVPGAKNTMGFTLNNNEIDKKLHWIGVGALRADTPVTAPSLINNELVIFTKNAAGSTVEGIRFYQLQIGKNTTNKCDNFILKRCVFRGMLNIFGNNCTVTGCLGYNTSTYTKNSYAGVSGQEVSENCLITNNIFVVPIYIKKKYSRVAEIVYFKNSTFSYNTLFANNLLIYGTQNCTSNNNIFFGYCRMFDSSLNTYLRVNNCAFSGGLPFTVGQTNPQKTIGRDCISGQSIAATIVGYNSWGANVYFSDTEDIITRQDFHIKASSPCKHAATDSREIGAYGGILEAYKPIPFYSHIEQATIGFWIEQATDKVNLKAKVSAQSR